MTNALNTSRHPCGEPWTLEFDRDGTEDVAVIRDADGEELVRSRQFWLPQGDDPIPPTLTAVRLMAAAPNLYRALVGLLERTVDQDLRYGVPLTEGEAETRSVALRAVNDVLTDRGSEEA